MSKKKTNQRIIGRIHGTFETQPLSSPDKRAKQSGIALPDDQNVLENKKWVDENQK